MESSLIQTKEAGLPPWVSRRLLTVDDYYRMAEIGILSPKDRIELIEGQIIQMPPIGSEHAGRVNRLTRLLITGVANRGVLSVQNPVRLSNISEPQPDFAVLTPRPDDYIGSHPTAQDVLLLIEVADSSPAYDRDVKTRLYARDGIPELWIVNVPQQLVTAYRTPGDDSHATVAHFTPQQTLAMQAFPDIELRAGELFPG